MKKYILLALLVAYATGMYAQAPASGQKQCDSTSTAISITINYDKDCRLVQIKMPMDEVEVNESQQGEKMAKEQTFSFDSDFEIPNETCLTLGLPPYTKIIPGKYPLERKNGLYIISVQL